MSTATYLGRGHRPGKGAEEEAEEDQRSRAGDEGLDLMASRIELSDSALLGCGGSGVSAGEETRVDIRDTLVAASKVGVLAKNASEVADGAPKCSMSNSMPRRFGHRSRRIRNFTSPSVLPGGNV